MTGLESIFYAAGLSGWFSAGQAGASEFFDLPACGVFASGQAVPRLPVREAVAAAGAKAAAKVAASGTGRTGKAARGFFRAALVPNYGFGGVAGSPPQRG